MPSYKVSGFNYLTDNRTKFKKRLPVYVALIWLLIGFVILIISLTRSKSLITPVASPQPVEAKEPTSADCDNPLCFIRRYGQEQGYDDYTISKFVRIARAESHDYLDQYAKNPYSSAKGIYQFIDSTWRHYCLKDGNVYDWKDNIKCFYKVCETDGYPKCLNHWNASKSKWL